MENDNYDDVPEGYDVVKLVDAAELQAELNAAVDDEGDDDDDEVTTTPDGQAPSVGEDSQRYDPVLARELADTRAKLAALQHEKETGLTEIQWDARRQSIQSQYRMAKANIFRLSKNDDEPEAFIEREMDRLIDWRDQELAKYHSSREADLKEMIARLKVPEYVDQLIKDFGLPKADRERLLEVGNPDEMRLRAQGLKELHELEKQIRGNNEKATKRSQRAIGTGASGSRNVRKVQIGSDEHLWALDPSLRPAGR